MKRKTKRECEASMRAFDALPDTFRQFCAAHGRTTNGQALAQILAAFDGNERDAARFLADQLPVLDTLGEEIRPDG